MVYEDRLKEVLVRGIESWSEMYSQAYLFTMLSVILILINNMWVLLHLIICWIITGSCELFSQFCHSIALNKWERGKLVGEPKETVHINYKFLLIFYPSENKLTVSQKNMTDTDCYNELIFDQVVNKLNHLQ